MRSPASWPNPPRRLRRVTGLLLVDKPPGPTSFAVIRRLRPVAGPKVGHAGTLDPFATGLLLVLAGRATRLATFLSGLDKRYRAVVQFGAVSSTLDPEGEISQTGGRTDAAAVREAAAALTGEVLQEVPLASAVRVDGERSYARMRRGEIEAPPPRMVTIERLEVISFDEQAQRAVIDVRCSKGTYVRQIAADLGAATAAGGYCSELRRTEVGGFTVDRAASPERILEEGDGPWMIQPRGGDCRTCRSECWTAARSRMCCTGGCCRRRVRRGPCGWLYDRRLVAVGRPDEQGLRPAVVLGA